MEGGVALGTADEIGLPDLCKGTAASRASFGFRCCSLTGDERFQQLIDGLLAGNGQPRSLCVFEAQVDFLLDAVVDRNLVNNGRFIAEITLHGLEFQSQPPI